ncbi:MAG TPA: hypothetical protein VLL54_12480 [Pyrinomonadaceae bacterium]|nr:hypothetical protein [Pyrinomonadaceae bacterium]
MATTSSRVLPQSSNAVKTIFWCGLIAGTLDITAACVYSGLRYGVTPTQIFHYIASGVFGAAAAEGGTKMAALGLIFHFIIATTWSVIYYLASRRLQFLIDQPIISGVLYGIVVYLLMNFVVVPLSFVAKRAIPPPISARLIQATILIFCIGLPIAFIVRRFSK